MKSYRNHFFPLLECLLYISFLAVDCFRWGDSTWLKFAAICLCAFTALIGANTRDAFLVAVAQCLTVAADWFLLVKDTSTSHIPGVSFFILVQFTYLLRLQLLRDKPDKRRLLLRALALLCAAVLFAVQDSVLNALALFYFANLLINTLEAAALSEKAFALGLALFVCCDFCVGLWNLNLQNALTEFARVGMWLFYLPSQVLIVLSAHQKGDTT